MAIRTPLALLAAALTFAGTAAVPATTTTASTPSPTDSADATSSYLPGDLNKEQNRRLTKQLAEAKARAEADRTNGVKKARAVVTTVYYDASYAPSFDSEISNTQQIWNGSVNNVRLVEDPSRATLYFEEGSSANGSYYQGNGHGSGLIFLDHDQANTYAPLRIVAHETGHALGLPDRYSQPCYKLMSGGGPGPSCTNPYPDSVEANEVDTIWRYGITAAEPAA
ncbi:snapalysin family zinc-dependent metalloprotease [Nocardioides sp. JQ2195]|uniref:snapalysin family zinc-dependent metalloprotease n=1 Tax=Nocardioides sp. JQ2195 TaxID=2592334 RepID=UPI00143EA5AA|nr:snapalysin family zinc-dependent metalloprotease [Nocardioides sp. JQ2195]QIX27708.1 snapalysin family zinc-dependent metalloprotease [Nocardioides sp. JQ2195]